MSQARIMIVEDDSRMSKFLKDSLYVIGYEVTSIVKSGELAIEKVKQDKPSLILMGIRLEGQMDGIEAARQIQSHSRIPIIYLTAYCDEELIKRAKETEPYGYLMKSHTYSQLRATIEIAFHKIETEKRHRESEEVLKKIKDELELRVLSQTSDLRDKNTKLKIEMAQRKVAQEELFNSNREKQIILNSLTELVTYQNRDHQIKWANRAHESYPNTSSGRLIGGYCYEIYQQRNAPCEDCPVEKAIEIGESIHTEKRTPDGLIWYISANPVKNSAGQIIGAVVTALEITELKRTEKALQETEDRYRLLFNGINDPVALIEFTNNKPGNFLEVNDTMCQILGYTREELLDLPVFSVAVPEDQRGVQLSFDELASGGFFLFETVFTSKEGRKIPAEVNINSIILEDEAFLLGSFRDLTARRRAEEELRESEEQWRSLTEYSPDYIMTLNRDAKILFINHTLPTANKKNIYGRSFFEFILPEYRKVASDCFERVCETGRTAIFENVFQRTDGTQRNFESHVGPVLRNGEVVGLTVSSRDVTERKLAEEALRDSEEKLRTIVEYSDIGSVVIQDGQRVFFNTKMHEMLGYTADEYANIDFLSLIHPEDKELVVSRLRRKQADEAFDSSPVKVRVLTKSGEIRWIETNSVRIQWGRRSALHVFTFDITERELADEKLRDAEASLKNTFNISPGLICVADANAGYFTECNPAVTRILGISVEEFTSTPFMEFVHPDDRQGTVDEIAKQLRGSTVANFENRYRCKDGSYKWLAWQATAADKNGKVHAVATDITEHKQAEEALKKSEKDLRTLSLRIFYAQEDERRRIGNELHDGIAQTLGAIKIWAETAEHEITINNSIKAKESLNRIVPLTQETIEEVRRISKNLHPPILDKIGILAAIDSLIDEFKHTHEEVQVINELNIDESDVPDSLRIVIYRVMQEALNNVSKHSRASLVRLSLNKSITKLELAIIDNGLGFDSGEVSSSQPGRGLGLTSMKERVILTGGNFVCESNKGKGTTLKASWIFSETN